MGSRVTFEVEFTPAARKEINKLDKSIRPRLFAAIEILRENPRPPTSIRLTNRSEYRIRVGDYRIVYEILDSKLVILVVRIGHRKSIYEWHN